MVTVHLTRHLFSFFPQLEGKEIAVTVSIGVAISNAETKDPEDLIGAADANRIQQHVAFRVRYGNRIAPGSGRVVLQHSPGCVGRHCTSR